MKDFGIKEAALLIAGEIQSCDLGELFGDFVEECNEKEIEDLDDLKSSIVNHILAITRVETR